MSFIFPTRKRDRFDRMASGLFVPRPLRMSPGYPCCCTPTEEPCPNCQSGTVAEEYLVEVAGNRLGCFNGTFVVGGYELHDGENDDCQSGTSNPWQCCVWKYTLDPPCVHSPTMTITECILRVVCSSWDTTWMIWVCFRAASGSLYTPYWSGWLNTQPGCDFSGYALGPWWAYKGTATVTAL